MMRPVRFTWSPSLISVYSPRRTTPNLVFLQVHGNARDVVRELEQFAGHDLLQAMDARNPVAERDNGADFVDSNLGFVVFDLLPD
jgi:hypothetical protein